MSNRELVHLSPTRTARRCIQPVLLFITILLTAPASSVRGQVMFLNEFATNQSPVDVVVNASGEVLVATIFSQGGVQKFTNTGHLISEFGTGISPWGVAVSPSGEIVVASSNGSVHRFTSAGAEIGSFAALGRPGFVTIDATGGILVVNKNDDRIDRYTSTGTLVTSFGTAQFSSGRPSGIGVDSNGDIFVANSLRNRIEKFTSSGTYIPPISGFPVGGQTAGLEINGDILYVVEQSNNRIQKFTTDGNFIEQFGSAGSAPGQLTVPSGVAVSSTGEVYVVDIVRAKILRYFDKDAWRDGVYPVTENLTVGSGGPIGDSLSVDSGYNLIVSGVTTVASGGTLTIGGGNFASSGIFVEQGGTIDLASPYTSTSEMHLNGATARISGTTLNNQALLHGDGRISTVLNNTSTGQVRASTGDRLAFTGTGNTNAGSINILGGTVEFTDTLTNTSTGFISGRGTLIASGGLDNQGILVFSGGLTDVLGDVTNSSGGRIITSGGGTTTFFDDVVHNGAEIRTSAGSSTVFLGDVSGAGAFTGTGTVFVEGDLRPGNSPTQQLFAGDLILASTTTTTMELGGLLRGTEYDAINIGGLFSMAGILDVVLYDLGGGLFLPQSGDSFNLFDWGTVSGSFGTINLPALGDGLTWNTSSFGSHGTFSVQSAAVPEASSFALLGLANTSVFVSL